MIIRYFKSLTPLNVEKIVEAKVERISSGMIKDGENLREGVEIEFTSDLKESDLTKLDAIMPGFTRETKIK